MDCKSSTLWIEYVHRRINSNKNWMVAIVGPTGSGKSWAALRLAEKLDPSFNVDRIAFSVGSFIKLIRESDLKSGNVIVFEEAGVAAGNKDALSRTNKLFGYLLQTFRYRNLIVIFTLPNIDFLDKQGRQLIHARWETKRIIKRHSISEVKAQLIINRVVKESTKAYYPFLKALDERGRRMTYPSVFLKAPSVKLRHAYEKVKHKYATELYDDMSVEFSSDKRKALTKVQREIISYKRENPQADQSVIAEAVGCGQQYVSIVLRGFKVG